MNNKPCTHPVNFTASGIPAKYFRGIAIKSNTNNEIPSAIPTFRNSVSELFILQRNREGLSNLQKITLNYAIS